MSELSYEELIQLGEELGIEIPQPMNDVNQAKLEREIKNYIKNNEDVSVEEYFTNWKAENAQANIQMGMNLEKTVVDTPVSTPKEENKSQSNIDKLRNLSFTKLIEKNSNNVLKTNAVSKEAMKLVRITVSTNNPNKRNMTGEIFTVQNSVIPEIKKFVPYNTPTHVPTIIYNVINERMMQTFYSERSPSGRMVKRSKQIKEYNIQVLPPLTAKELDAIKQKQLAEKAQIS